MAIPLLVLIALEHFSIVSGTTACPAGSWRLGGACYWQVVARLPSGAAWALIWICELQTVDAQPYRGRARLTEFLDDPEQRALFDA